MISAVILARNEEANISDCIKSISFCDEIVVIDDNSSDKTVPIARGLGARVIIHSLNEDFSQQRNFALSEVKFDWVIFVDADERVSSELMSEIKKVISEKSKISGYYIRRIDNMWGRFLKYGETGSIYLLRLAKKNSGAWKGKVHESWVSKQPTHELKSYLFHYPHVTAKLFLEKINFYSTLRSKELYAEKVRVNFFDILAYPAGKFIQNYIFKFGLLDGVPGLLLAVFMSFHSYLVRGKLWQLWEKQSDQNI